LKNINLIPKLHWCGIWFSNLCDIKSTWLFIYGAWSSWLL